MRWHSKMWMACFAVMTILVQSVLAAPTRSETIAATIVPEDAMAQGWQAMQRGAFDEAVSYWLTAAQRYQQEGHPQAQSAAWMQLAQGYQALGQHQQALHSLTTALALAEPADDRTLIATLLGHLGNLHLIMGAIEDARQHLQEGLRLARETGSPGLTATLLNNLGNLFTTRMEYDQALVAYTDSVHLAQQVGEHALAARALSNTATVTRRLGQPRQAQRTLERAGTELQHVEPSHDKAYDFITLGLAYSELRVLLPADHDRLLLQAAAAFNDALHVAQKLGDQRAASYALGYLGGLYTAEQRYMEALQLTRRALFAAQQVQAPESLYRWQWQLAHLLNAQGDTEAALSAYRQAVSTLQSFRHEVGYTYGRGRVSFREVAEPVYFGFVDLLLQRAAALPERTQYEPYLREAQEVVELLKAVELQDYFQDACVDAARTTTTSLEMVSPTTAVVYPIILPNRLELLVDLPAGLKRTAVPVTADVLTRDIRTFRLFLEKRTTHEYLPYAQRLYDWLIRPLEAELAATVIDTLVFVPDGPLRTIPMAALHDGREFLISKYALAITPGLNLTDPQPLPRDNLTLLAVGLSEAVQGFAALPNVAGEIAAIQRLYDSETLIDERFLRTRMEEKLQKKPFTIVHIASHGQFRSDVMDTFLLTFDDKLTLDRLDQVIGALRGRGAPLELLTLSACQTAAGDDRAALGLAGVAVKAGARSALATLWYINDQASSELVAEFYRHLRDPAISRAMALQRAQIGLLQQPRYRHPGYWAPFLLINNWL